MTDTPAARKRRFRLWLTISELVGVLALVIAGLNFWDSHRERVQDSRREAAADHAASARYAFVMSSQMEAEGARLTFQAVNPAQAIQAERYLFPRVVLGHAMEVSAAKPQIDLDWIEAGLRSRVALARKAGAGADGEATLPVGVIATYVQDGEMRTDQSIYRLGYAWRPRFLGGPRLALQGVSLIRRGVQGDLRAAVESAWRRQAEGSGA
jgi:hypothetical protein